MCMLFCYYICLYNFLGHLIMHSGCLQMKCCFSVTPTGSPNVLIVYCEIPFSPGNKIKHGPCFLLAGLCLGSERCICNWGRSLLFSCSIYISLNLSPMFTSSLFSTNPFCVGFFYPKTQSHISSALWSGDLTSTSSSERSPWSLITWRR